MVFYVLFQQLPSSAPLCCDGSQMHEDIKMPKSYLSSLPLSCLLCGQSHDLCSTDSQCSQHPPMGYRPRGLSGQLLDRWPFSWQMKHLANGNSPVLDKSRQRQRNIMTTCTRNCFIIIINSFQEFTSVHYFHPIILQCTRLKGDVGYPI